MSGKLYAVKFWSEFHKQHSSKEFSTNWESCLDKKKLIFYQHFTLKLFEQVLSNNFQGVHNWPNHVKPLH